MERTHPPAARGRSGLGQQGMALITTIMVLMLCSALMVGFVSAVVADNRVSSLNNDQTQAYAAAHAGLEKLTSDLAALFGGNFAPTAAQVGALTVDALRPAVPGFTYVAPDGGSGYRVTFNEDGDGNPAPADALGTTISHGPYQGFKGIITPYDITVTARATGGAEVRMRRTLQTIAVPVFQFGMFSETDLAFHAGEPFAFGGRVHTNGNLFLAQGDGTQLRISDRVTAVGEVIRTHLPNGLAIGNGYGGTVSIIRAPNSFRNLLSTEASLKGTLGSQPNEPKWTQTSIGAYNSYIRNGLTGARRLDLPLVSQGAAPIDLIRRPQQGSNEALAAPLIYQQRYYGMASLRILLSDTAAEITSLPTIDLTQPPVELSTGTAYAGGGPPAHIPPLAESVAHPGNSHVSLPANIYLSASTPLIGGFIKIEMQRADGAWQDVTTEILRLGIAGRNPADNNIALANRWNSVPSGPGDTCGEASPDAVIRLQRLRDIPVAMPPCGFHTTGGIVDVVSPQATDYWPNTLYDTRDAQNRDGIASTNLALGGIVHYVELDVNNLRRWLEGTIGVSGSQARNNNGFIVYFSDRRNNKSDVAADCGALPTPCETGEYGWEDVVNPTTAAGTAGGALDTGEDLNGNGRLDTYGSVARNVPASAIAPMNAAATNLDVLSMGSRALVARANRTLFFRRALKIVNGAQGNLPTPGLTIASENPVYLQGNYNATAASVSTGAHAAAAIITDAITLLSNNWHDSRSFTSPTDSTGRPATTTGYRVALVTGKGIPFPKPGFASSSFGSDGGVHNFMRNLENWNVGGVIQRYRGSMVSFYVNRQGTGTFKCCLGDTYVRGDREWSFDTDFLTPSLLPPGTPMFRDINTLTFRQLLRPTQ